MRRRDFLAFVRAAEKYGRTELDKIAGEVEGKAKEEVVAYSQVGHRQQKGWDRVQQRGWGTSGLRALLLCVLGVVLPACIVHGSRHVIVFNKITNPA